MGEAAVERRVVATFDVDGSRPDLPVLDLAEFSRFKHGATGPAWRLGEQVARRLTADCADAVFADRLVVTASCYKFLPLASVTLARVVAYRLNRVRADAGCQPVTVTQFYRMRLIEGDYSTMSLRQREEFIAQDVIQIDPATLPGAAVVVVDDLRVTGFHEGRLAAVLEAEGVPAATFAYCVAIDGRADPTVEQRMNQTSVDGLDALAALIGAGGFQLNSRVCKLILGAPPDEISRFVTVLPVHVLADLVSGLECNGYAAMGRYRAAYEEMTGVLRQRRGLAVR